MSGSNSDPGFTYGEIPSAITWDAAFSVKVDADNGVTVSPLRLKVYTVATLPTPTAAIANSIAAVSDATSPTYNGALTGGGTVHVPVFCDGAAWKSH